MLCMARSKLVKENKLEGNQLNNTHTPNTAINYTTCIFLLSMKD